MADAKTKAEREAEARRALLGGKTREQAMAEFIAKGNPAETPGPAEPAMPASTPEHATTAAEASTPAVEVSEPQADTGAAIPAAEPAEGPEGHQVAEKAARAPKKATPWAHAHPRVLVNFSTKFSEELHMQMTWLTENVPKTSIQKIVQEATAQYVAKKIKEHYKP